MASSSKPKTIYHVFLSFRGEDVQNDFLGHLYRALDQEGIYTYVDGEEIKRRKQTVPALMKAIEESHIAIIIFSKDYASSWWCLEEVAKIMDCKEERDLMVFPVFYKVESQEVRTPIEKYKEDMLKHESEFGKDSAEVKRWKKALSNAGSLFGWHLKDGDESELIHGLVTEISTHLDRTPLHVARYPVGIDSRVIKLKSILNLESNDDVLMMGLWGQGGIGKTTLAKALYNDIFKQFENSCFLVNVQEASKDCGGFVTLQEKLLFEILALKERLVVYNVYSGIRQIRDRLCHKKVLLILDDVDDLCQLEALAGEGKWFGNGSRIVITTRDEHLLIKHGIDLNHVYEVKELNDSVAHELLSKHAFVTRQKLKIKTNLENSALNHAKGLPLALEVLGSFLRGRREDEWKNALDKISMAPMKGIYDVLKISYDGLEKNEREIFLDIVCFFKGRHSEYIKRVFDSFDFGVTKGLEILIERSLISIERHGFLKVHELIQGMGIEIVKQECRDDPSKRSRLWLFDDVANALSSDKEDCAVEAIVLEQSEPTEMHINPYAFAKMKRLRLLILHNVHNSFKGPIYLPNGLRWFEWPGCAQQILEFSSGIKRLVGLNMNGGNFTRVVRQLKGFRELKYINFNNCESLVTVPDLSSTPNLEQLVLRNCKNLVEVHQSLAYLDKLELLNLKECSNLSIFPNELKSKNLQVLNFENCTKFERFPDIPHKLKALKELFLQATAIKELPVSIENLVSLKEMHLNYCKKLTRVPSNVYMLQNIEFLGLMGCTNLIKFPKYEDLADSFMKTGLSNLLWLDLRGCNLFEVDFLENLSCFPFLSELWLDGNNITSLPTSINKRNHLSVLGVTNCQRLQEIPELPPFLKHLRAENCKSLQKNGGLTSFDDFVRRGLSMAHISTLRQV